MAEITCPLDLAAEKFGAEPALILDDRAITYSDYRRLVSRAQGKLIVAGVRRGDRVAIVADNSYQYVVVLLALIKMGAVACPINPRFPRSLIEKTIASVEARFLVLSKDVDDVTLNLSRLALEGLAADLGAATDGPVTALDLDRDATILQSSGTTGTPKAALLTCGNHYFSALGSNRNIAVQPGDRWLLSLPLHHVGGLGIIFRALLSGAAVALPSKGMSLRQAADFFRVTHLSLVSTQLYRLLRQNVPTRLQPERLKAILLGGGPVPAALVNEAVGRSLPLYTSYGLTEMGSQVSTTRPGDAPEKLLTSGRPLPHREMRIAEDGEILVKGETLFKGYYQGGSVSKVTDRDGWWATGDLGQMDSDGYLTVLGRKDNMFVSAGESIQPEEIETALHEIEGVAEVVVVSISDTEYGHRPVAFIRWEGAPLGDDRIKGTIRQRLPGIKIPVAFHEWPSELAEDGLKPPRGWFSELAAKLRAKRFSG